MTDAAATLRENEQRLPAHLLASVSGSLIAHNADAILVADSDNHICFWNKGAESMFGYVESEILGRPVSVLVPGGRRYRKELRRINAELKSEGFMRNLQTDRLRKDGQKVPVLLTTTVIKEEDDTPLGSSLIMKDITTRVELEGRLIQSEKLSAIGHMASHVVHEIRNPLGSIILNLDLLDDEVADYAANGAMNATEAAELLKAIRKELLIIKNVTDEYLMFARLPRSRPVRRNLNRIIEELVRFFRQEFEVRGIAVTSELDESVPTCIVQAHKLRQALLNIVKNSIEAMSRGGRLTIATKPLARHSRIEITDTGSGIPKELQEKVFGAFFSTKHKGTGLGLTFARGVVDDLGGRIRIRSKPGKGTTVTIDIPSAQKQT